MAHRGPDGDGVWISDDNKTGLGHRRLAIVDLSEAGRQPMGNRDGSIQVTFNGEIYNHRELRSDLESRGFQFRSQSDTEVLPYLYEQYGEAMIERLDGDFAFGLWDSRKQKLILARDRAGLKPIYFTNLGNQFLFASEIKALLTHPGVARDIDEEALYHYLTFLVVPPPFTLFQGISKVHAAECLTLDLRDDGFQIRSRRYWEPLPNQCELQHSNLDGQFRDLFGRSVEKRLMSDVPVGVLFSGGVDSTLNAASFAAAIAPQKVRTFHVGVEGTKIFDDETDFATSMALRLNTEHHQVRITESDLLDAMLGIARQQDEPLADPVCVPLYFVTKLARETGTTVLHAGEGADEIFCGYDKYRRFMDYRDRFWSPLCRLPRFAHRLAFELLKRGHSKTCRKMADSILRMARRQEFFVSSSVAFYEYEKQSVLGRDFRNRHEHTDSFNVVSPMYDRVAEHIPNATFLQILTYIELQLRLPELLLMRVDKMSMLNSVEVRVPFLDRDLVDFALSAPESFKLRDGISKEPVKRMAAEFVPRDLIYRRKSGFGAPIQEWFASKLGRDMDDQLQADRHMLGQWFDVAALRKRLQQPPPTANDAFQLWVIYNFMLWRRSFLDVPQRAAA